MDLKKKKLEEEEEKRQQIVSWFMIYKFDQKDICFKLTFENDIILRQTACACGVMKSGQWRDISMVTALAKMAPKQLSVKGS